MKRDFTKYDIVFCDIDHTLVYGPFVEFMKWSWNVFKCQWFGHICMFLQSVFKWYKPNKELIKILKGCKKVIFLTARAENVYTDMMVDEIMGYRPLTAQVIATGAASPCGNKIHSIRMAMADGSKVCLLDDNFHVREACLPYCDCFDVTHMFEPLIDNRKG